MSAENPFKDNLPPQEGVLVEGSPVESEPATPEAIAEQERLLGENLDHLRQNVGEMPTSGEIDEAHIPDAKVAAEQLERSTFEAWAKSRGLFDKYFTLATFAGIAPSILYGAAMYLSPEMKVPDVPAFALEYLGYVQALTQEQWSNLSQNAKYVHNFIALWNNLGVGLMGAMAVGGIGKIQEQIKKFKWKSAEKKNRAQ